MSYTTFAGVRTWDGSEAVSVHGASNALSASIDGSLVPSFVNETARNTAAAAMIAAGKTGMTCHVQSRRGTCTFIGIPAGGAEPVNGWIWHAQNRIIYDYVQTGGVIGSTGNNNWVTVHDSPSTVLNGGKRLINFDWGCDIMASDAPGGNLSQSAGVRVILGINGIWLDEMLQHPMGPTVAGAAGFTAVSLYRVIKKEMAAGTYVISMQIGMYTSGTGFIDAHNPRITVTDLGPID